jgi:hypothetical protein
MKTTKFLLLLIEGSSHSVSTVDHTDAETLDQAAQIFIDRQSSNDKLVWIIDKFEEDGHCWVTEDIFYQIVRVP